MKFSDDDGVIDYDSVLRYAAANEDGEPGDDEDAAPAPA